MRCKLYVCRGEGDMEENRIEADEQSEAWITEVGE